MLIVYQMNRLYSFLESIREKRFYKRLNDLEHRRMQRLLDREHEAYGFTHEFCEYSAEHNWPSYIRFGFNYHREK